MRRIILSPFSITLLLLLFQVSHAPAMDADVSSDILPDFLKENIRLTLKTFIQGIVAAPPSTAALPPAPPVFLPRYLGRIDFRPDLYFSSEKLYLSLKPRYEYSLIRYEDTSGDIRTRDEDRLYVNEWLARIALTTKLYASYGRENLQWGGAYLFSPSNPFFTNNGRQNPKEEVKGMDFIRSVYIPDMKWTLSFIGNMDDGAADFDRTFEQSFALKVDYTGMDNYLGVIAAQRRDNGGRIGVFGGKTWSDALLLYFDGFVGEKKSALYPLGRDDFTNSAAIAETFDSESLTGSIIVGAGYTLRSGPTLSGEFFFNGPGELLRGQETRLKIGGNAGGRMIFQNSRYLLLQYLHNDINNACDLVLRCIHGLDDGSGQLLGIIDYDLSDHVGLFTVSSFNYGTSGSEYGDALDYQLIIGLEYTY